MTANGLPRILVCIRQPNTLAEMRHLLAGAGCEVVGHLLGASDPDRANLFQSIVIEGGQGAAALDLCRRLRERLDNQFVPILYVTDDGSPAARLASFECGADTYLLRPFAAGELLAQVKALLRIKDAHDRLAGKTVEMHRVNLRLQQLHQQIDYEMQLAQRIQSSLLPRTLPAVTPCRFAVHYLPRDRVGGDFYDAFRLDENHIGLYVADAMGHGVPASLLTIFVKKGVTAKEVFGQEYRLVPPEEVLQRLNKDLIEQHLSEHPFITMVYALYNHQEGAFRFARAGHPYPLYVPREGEPTFWRQEGLLLGVVDAVFPARTYCVHPGDKVLLYSDGIDSGRFEDHAPGHDSLRACAARHRHLSIQPFVDRLARDLFDATAPPDDLTLLGLEVRS
ncbi:MAG TPA: SpoIIE family protein phosphatase [Gemmataceae bacterium]|jgi:sigma-B regulation protein RsbU (phosphoserine phosphatase)